MFERFGKTFLLCYSFRETHEKEKSLCHLYLLLFQLLLSKEIFYYWVEWDFSARTVTGTLPNTRMLLVSRLVDPQHLVFPEYRWRFELLINPQPQMFDSP